MHSFFHFAAFTHEHGALIQRVLAIPQKRVDRQGVAFLTRPELEALLAAPDRTTWIGRRDHALLILAVQTGLRVCELIGLSCGDVVVGTGAMFGVTAKAERTATRPSPARPKPYCESGWPNVVMHPTTRSSPAAEEDHSAPTRSSCSLASTPGLHADPARRCAPRP